MGGGCGGAGRSSALEGSLDLEVVEGRADLASAPKGSIAVDVESLRTGNKLYDRELERQLEVRKYPRIRGEVREVERARFGADGTGCRAISLFTG